LKKQKHQGTIHFLTDRLEFPPLDDANPDGLLAVGGDLSSERLLLAYQSGIFPWFNENSLILWWSPDPRMVLYPQNIKISKSMRKVMKEGRFELRKNTCFNEVIDFCARIERKGQEGTWITNEMRAAYGRLHQQGYAKSYEVFENDELVGGLYGIDLGHIFCGESMFSLRPNASKFAFIALAKELQSSNYACIDCQLYTKHLESLGAEEVPRKRFMEMLKGKN
jgi:leucyl/phenylalanyl-tRNA--protein transferase